MPRSFGSRWTPVFGLILLCWGAAAGAAPAARPAPTDADAARLPRVYLVPVQRSASNVSSLIPRRINARLRVDFAAEQSVELMPALGERKAGAGAGSIYRLGAKAEPDVRKIARQLLARGKAAYEAGRYPEAQGHLLRAIQLFEKSVAYLEDGDTLADAFGTLGLCLLRLNKTAMATDAIETAYALNPTIKLDKRPMPRTLRRVVRRAGRRTLRRRKAQLQITVTPPGAWVYVDGDEKGKAPLTLRNVLPGRHYVSARMKGRLSRSAVLNVKPGKTHAVTLALPDATPQFSSARGLAHAFQAEIANRLEAGLVDRRVKPLAGQLAKRLKADYLVLAAAGRGDQGGYLLRTYLYRHRDGKLVELDSFRFDGELLNLTAGTGKVADAVAAAVAKFPASQDITYVRRPRLRPGGGTGHGGPSDLVGVVHRGDRTVHSTRRPWYLRWAFWGTVIGVVVAGGIAGAGVGIYSATHRESAGYKISVEVR